MKKVVLLILVVFGLVSSTIISASAQKRGAVSSVSDLDSLAGLKYSSYDGKRDELIKKHEASTDSAERVKLIREYNAIDAKCTLDIFNLYARYGKVEGAISRLYALRTSVDKSQLEKVLNKISKDVSQSDPYVASIRAHIDSRQISLGDTVGNFRAKMARGADFRFSEFTGEKDVLLIFGGLDCMGKDMYTILQVMYRKVDLTKLEIVSIFPEEDKVAFEAEVLAKNVPWVSICDFRGDHSPLKIAFGVQATPTCFYIGKGGRVEAISVGISDDILALITSRSRN